MPGFQGSLHLVPGGLADPQRVPVHLRSRDCQGLEAVHTALRQKHEAPTHQRDPDHTPSDLRLRRLQNFITSGKSPITFILLKLSSSPQVVPQIVPTLGYGTIRQFGIQD